MVQTAYINSTSSNTTMSQNYDTYIINASSGNITMTLPNITADGIQFLLRREDTSANTVTIIGTGGQLITTPSGTFTSINVSYASDACMHSISGGWYTTGYTKGISYYFNAFDNGLTTYGATGAGTTGAGGTGAFVIGSTGSTGTRVRFPTIGSAGPTGTTGATGVSNTWVLGSTGGVIIVPVTGTYLVHYFVTFTNLFAGTAGTNNTTISAYASINGGTPVQGFGGTHRVPSNHIQQISGQKMVSFNAGDSLSIYVLASSTGITFANGNGLILADDTISTITLTLLS